MSKKGDRLMIYKYKFYMGIMALYIATMGTINACMMTFVNDSNGKVAIFNEQDKTFTPLVKNGKRRFGSQHKHAHFVVYTQQPKTKTEIWTQAYTCQQNICGTSGNIVLRFSDIQNNTGETGLFTITKHKTHSSMVQDLPMIQQKTCSACNQE